MSRIVRLADSSLRATCFTALVVCQTVGCGSSDTSAAGQGQQRSDAGREQPDAGDIVDGATAGDGSGRTYPSPSPKSIALFDEGTIVDFYVTFSDDAWNKLLPLTGPNDTRWVPCTFTALGEPVVNADCRRKADMGGWSYEKKPQFIVRFNLTNKEGRFRGLRRLNLESFDGAAAPIRDRIGMWVMREAAIDAPRVNHDRPIDWTQTSRPRSSARPRYQDSQFGVVRSQRRSSMPATTAVARMNTRRLRRPADGGRPCATSCAVRRAASASAARRMIAEGLWSGTAQARSGMVE